MSEKFQGSNSSQDPREVKSLVVAPLRQMPPGFASREDWENFQFTVIKAFKSKMAAQGVSTQEDAIMIALKGRELRLDPIYSLSQIYVVNGKCGLQAEVMRALVYRQYPKAKLKIVTPVERRHLECKIVAAREGGEDMEFMFTMDDATRAGLVTKDKNGEYRASPGKQVWNQYPGDMLVGRATSRAVRFLWPECVMGMGYTPEELESGDSDSRRDDVAAIDSQFTVDATPVAPEENKPAALAPGPSEIDGLFNTVIDNQTRLAPEPLPVVVPTLAEEDLLPFEKKVAPIKAEPIAGTEIHGGKLGDHRITMGRLIGKTLAQVKPEELQGYLRHLKGQSPNASINDLIAKIEAFIKENTNG